MAHVTAGKTDASASLSAVQTSLDNLRTAVNNYAADPPTARSAASAPPKLLVLAITLKVSNDRILQDVEDARARTLADQQLLLSSRQRLSSLRYERALLEREIAACRAAPTPALDALALPLPGSEASDDEAAARAHEHALDTLNAELANRRAAGAEVRGVVKAAAAKREALAVARKRLRHLPEAMRALGDVVEPVRKLLDADTGALANAAEVAEARRLPAPLYVLAREAFAFRAFFPGHIGVAIVGDEGVPPGGDGGGEGTDVYRIHALSVRLDVYADEERSAPWLEATFVLHEALQVVGVRARLARVAREPGEAVGDTPLCTRELDELFPHDDGGRSPNASNAHLEEGRFAFSQARAGGSRPYVWANVACGLAYLEALEGAGAFAEWPRVAAREAAHVRFREVAERLRERLRAIARLEAEVESVRQGSAGGGEEVRAEVQTFEEVAAEEGRKVWRVVVTGAAATVEGRVEVGRGTVVFRLVGGAEEAVLREMEMEVNATCRAGAEGGGLVDGMLALRRAVDAMAASRQKTALPASLANLLC